MITSAYNAFPFLITSTIEEVKVTKIAIKPFEVAKDTTVHKFDKAENFITTSKSALKDLLRDKTGAIHKLTQLTIFLPIRPLSVHVQAKETTLIEDIIKEALKQYDADTKTENKQPLSNLPKAYLFRFAEPDGSPDEDMPALDRSREIGQFLKKGLTSFALCLNPEFKGEELVYWLSALPFANIFSFAAEDEEGGDAPKRIRIHLPNDGGFLSINVRDNTSLKEVKEQVCERRLYI